MFKAFFLGMREFRLSMTTAYDDEALRECYDKGRDLACWMSSLGDMTERQWLWYSVRTFYLPMAISITTLCICMAVLHKWVA